MGKAEKIVRRSFSGRHCIIPELKMAGWDIFRHAAPQSLVEHLHPTAYEICYIAGGSVDWWVEAEMYELRPGDVFITRPGERHGGVDAVMHPCELYWLQIVVPKGIPLPGIEKRMGLELAESLAKIRLRRFPGADSIPLSCEKILKELAHPSPMCAIALRAALHELLVDVIRLEATAQRHGTARLSPRIAGIVRTIDEHPEANDSVTALAKLAGVSVSRFHELFVAETGYSPAEYRTRKRLGKAKHLLRSGDQSITEIAMGLGFSTSQYFATVFHHYTGLSPREYRGQSKENSQ